MSAPQQWCTGPAHVFVGLGSGGAPLYFGSCERFPRPVFSPVFIENPNDIAGGKPLDKSFQGEDAVLSGDFTRWDEPMFAQMQARPNYGGTRGVVTGGGLGAFMGQEGYSYPVWIQYPYSAKAAMNNLPAGYRFRQCWLEGPDHVEPGTTPYKIRIMWYALPIYVPDTNNSIRAILYDHDMTGLPSIT